MPGKTKAADKPKQFDVEAELVRLNEDDDKLAAQADKIAVTYNEAKQKLKDIAAERRAGWERMEALKRARSMGIEHLRALHQMIEDVGGIESLTVVGTPDAGGED